MGGSLLPEMGNEALADAGGIVGIAGELGREGALLEHGARAMGLGRGHGTTPLSVSR